MRLAVFWPNAMAYQRKITTKHTIRLLHSSWTQSGILFVYVLRSAIIIWLKLSVVIWNLLHQINMLEYLVRDWDWAIIQSVHRFVEFTSIHKRKSAWNKSLSISKQHHRNDVMRCCDAMQWNARSQVLNVILLIERYQHGFCIAHSSFLLLCAHLYFNKNVSEAPTPSASTMRNSVTVARPMEFDVEEKPTPNPSEALHWWALTELTVTR